MVTTPNTAIKFTYNDYINTPEDKRYELLDGELILSEAPSRNHQGSQVNIGSPLHVFVRSNGLGVVYFAPRDVMLTDTDVVQPDLMFISNERLHIDTERAVHGAPDLVVEVLSPSTSGRDRTFKRALYARHGVKEYWLVDPTARTIAVLLHTGDGFEAVATYGEGDTLASPTLQGFRIDVDEVF